MNDEMKRRQDLVLEYATALATKVAEDLRERTGLDWVITPDACYLDWSLDFRCPGAPVDCIQVGSGFFAGVREILNTTDVYTQNWMVYRITDCVLSHCLTKCLHSCCRKDPDSIWYPPEHIHAQTQAQ